MKNEARLLLVLGFLGLLCAGGAVLCIQRLGRHVQDVPGEIGVAAGQPEPESMAKPGGQNVTWEGSQESAIHTDPSPGVPGIGVVGAAPKAPAVREREEPVSLSRRQVSPVEVGSEDPGLVNVRPRGSESKPVGVPPNVSAASSSSTSPLARYGLQSGGASPQLASGDREADAQRTDDFAEALTPGSPSFPLSSPAPPIAPVGEGDPGVALDGPVELRPLQHEGERYGWRPDFYLNAPGFGPSNEVVIRNRTSSNDLASGIELFDGERWSRRSFVGAIRGVYPTFSKTVHGAGHAYSARVVVDDAGAFYTLVGIELANGGRKTLVLDSIDQGRTWSVAELPFTATYATLEYGTGYNDLSGPPVLAAYARPGGASQGLAGELWLFRSERDSAGTLDLGSGVMISDQCLGMGQHSGGSQLATRGGRTHIVYAEVTDNPDAVGAPTFIRSLEHASGKLNDPVRLGETSGPANDEHDIPALCLDSLGHIHVVFGAHNREFLYTRSQRSNDVAGGWSDPVPTWPDARQTYVGLVCGPADELILVSRLYAPERPYFGGRWFRGLSMQVRGAGGRWSIPRFLVVPPVVEYSVYYHQVAVDRAGGLYVSYNYYSSAEPYASTNELGHLYRFRSLLVSNDAGESWSLGGRNHFTDAYGRAGGAPVDPGINAYPYPSGD